MNFIESWLAHRLERLYEVNGSAEAADVQKHMKDIFANAHKTYAKLLTDGMTLPADMAAATAALQASLRDFTGLSSVAGRIARMETEHMIEGLRHFIALTGTEKDFEVAGGPSLVQPSVVKIELDPAKTLTNNASATTSDLAFQKARSPVMPLIAPAPVFTPTEPPVEAPPLAAEPPETAPAKPPETPPAEPPETPKAP